jgi:hypothetical protein
MFLTVARRLRSCFASCWKTITNSERSIDSDASQERKLEKGSFPEYQGRDARWEAAETSNRYRHVEGRQNEEEVMAKGKPKGKGKPIFPAATSKDGNKGPKYPAK